jgi:hypothetical protein
LGVGLGYWRIVVEASELAPPGCGYGAVAAGLICGTVGPGGQAAVVRPTNAVCFFFAGSGWDSVWAMGQRAGVDGQGL